MKDTEFQANLRKQWAKELYDWVINPETSLNAVEYIIETYKG
jgi:hypothetical protein